MASSVESTPSMTWERSLLSCGLRNAGAAGGCTFPKIVYFPSRCGCFAYVMKNWDLLVSWPEFAIATMPRLLNCRASDVNVVIVGTQVARSDLERGTNFVRKRGTVDALSPLAGTRGIARLDHEPSDIAVPDASIVVSRGTQC